MSTTDCHTIVKSTLLETNYEPVISMGSNKSDDIFQVLTTLAMSCRPQVGLLFYKDDIYTPTL